MRRSREASIQVARARLLPVPRNSLDSPQVVLQAAWDGEEESFEMSFSAAWLPILEQLGLIAGSEPIAPPLGCDEETLQAAIIDLAKRRQWLCYHTRDSRRSVKGFPDLVMVRGKRLIFAELKKIGKRPTKEQSEWIDAIRFAGVPCFVWRSEDWPQIVAELEGRKNEQT